MTSVSKRQVQGIVLAGVHAWGSCPLEQICPRPLLPIAGRPLIWYGLEWLRRGGITQAGICANSDTEALRLCLGDGQGQQMQLQYYEDTMPRGPAGCAKDAAGHSSADTFVVFEGTLLPAMPLARMLETHFHSGVAMTVAVRGQASGPGDDSPEPVGVYLVSRSALEHVPPNGYQDIKESWIPLLYRQKCPVVPYPVEPSSVFRVSGARSYLSALGWAIEALPALGGSLSEYERSGNAWVHRKARREADVRLMGPVLIGPGAHLMSNASIIGPAVVGPGSVIGRSAIINRAMISSDCRVEAGAVVSHCILLRGAMVEPGSVVRNATLHGAAFSHFDLTDGAYWALTGQARAAGAQPSQPQRAPARPKHAGRWMKPRLAFKKPARSAPVPVQPGVPGIRSV